jgi:predicted transcriptional regulator
MRKNHHGVHLAAGGPVTTAEIIRHLPDGKDWKQNTVVTFLARLIEKEYLRQPEQGKSTIMNPA